MGVTRNLLSSTLFTLPFLGYQPANISNGEPALTAANLVKGTMLGPPMTWIWNRNSASIPIPAKTAQDFYVVIPDFGFLEQAWLVDSEGKIKEIAVRKSLAGESSEQRPASVSAQQQDSDGGVTIRLNTIADEDYELVIYYQMAAVTMTSMASTWGPIPDNLSYVYDWGFLAMLSLLTKDARMPFFMGKFLAHLLGNQDGLTALQRNIFLGNWLDVMTAQERATLNTQQGITARQQ
jgi:hypothetical protein